jgi:hypothetical protein
VRGAWEEGSIAPVPRSPARVCSATTLGLGACFIDPYQNGPTNAETQRSCPDFFVRRNGRLSKAESAQARATDRVFSRHLLARACKTPRLCRSLLMCAHPSNPHFERFHQLLFLPRRSALLTARESHVLHLLACAGMAVNTHGVHIEQAEPAAGCYSCARGPISVGWCWPAPSRWVEALAAAAASLAAADLSLL